MSAAVILGLCWLLFTSVRHFQWFGVLSSWLAGCLETTREFAVQHGVELAVLSMVTIWMLNAPHGAN